MKSIFGNNKAESISSSKVFKSESDESEKDGKMDEELEEALKRGGKFFSVEEEDLDLDEEDKQIEIDLTKAFYKLSPSSRETMQKRIPLKILKRLKYQHNKEKEREKIRSQYSFYQNHLKKKQ